MVLSSCVCVCGGGGGFFPALVARMSGTSKVAFSICLDMQLTLIDLKPVNSIQFFNICILHDKLLCT